MKKEFKFILIITLLIIIGFLILLLPSDVLIFGQNIKIEHTFSISQILSMYVNIVLAVFILRALSNFENQESYKKKIALELLQDYISTIQTDINAILYKKKRELNFVVPLFKKYNSRLLIIHNLLKTIKKDNNKINQKINNIKKQIFVMKKNLTDKVVFNEKYIYTPKDESYIDQAYINLLKNLHELTILIINS